MKNKLTIGSLTLLAAASLALPMIAQADPSDVGQPQQYSNGNYGPNQGGPNQGGPNQPGDWHYGDHRRFHHDQDQPDYSSGQGNAVVVGGIPVMRFRFAAGGFSPTQRAFVTQDRVNKFLSEGPIAPGDITTQTFGTDAVVLVRGQLLFTADAQTAQFNSTTPIELANTWADNVRNVLPSITQSHG